ncbi:MAG TPA: sialidase family protein [Ktedonobacterales bacterium]|jgi:hypothetical protein
MKQIITKRSVWLNAMTALLVIAGMGAFFTLGAGHTKAAPSAEVHHASAEPHLANSKENQPLARRNPILNGDDGGGDDDTSPSPTLSALCQDFLGNPNPYSNPAPNVDQIVNDAVVPVGSQTGCGTPQNETTIAVNPNNPNNLVAGTNDYRVFNTRENRVDGSGYAYVTFDGGTTWTNVQLPHLTFQTGATGALSDMDSAGDPALSFGPNNTVYYANLVFSRLNAGSGIVVSISHDGGLTWSEPSIVHTDGVDANGNPLPASISNDKEWVGVDPRNSNVAYVTWTEFGPDGSPIVVSKTTNGGATWSAPVEVNPPSSFTPGGVTPFSQGSYPLVNSHGTLFIAYESAVCQTLNCDQATDHDEIIVAKSTDGGTTFTNTQVSLDFDFPFNPDVGRSTLTGENWRINSFPSFAIDRTTDQLYVTWADDRNGLYDANGNSIKTNGDVFINTSTNGTQWRSELDQIGTTDDEVYPGIAAYNGRVVVSFYTRHYDPSGINIDYAWAGSNGLGNLQHAAVHRITTQSEDPNVQFVGVGFVTGQILQGEFIGDYTAVAMGTDLRFHPCWTDFRGNPNVANDTPNQDAYSQSIKFP